MAGRLDLASLEVLGVAECDLALGAAAAHEWPCPACGEEQSLRRAWALKVRERTDRPMERAVVVCNDCFVSLGDTVADRIAAEPVTISEDDDPIELLRNALDTDEVDVAFQR